MSLPEQQPGGIYKANLNDFGISDVHNDVNSTSVNIFPNPASDYISIFFIKTQFRQLLKLLLPIRLELL